MGDFRSAVLRAWPGTEGWRPPTAGLRPVASFTRRLGLVIFAAADAGAEGDRLGLGAVLVVRGPLVFHGVLLVADDLGARDPEVFRSLEAWAQDHPLATILGPAPWRVLTVSEWADPLARVEDPATHGADRPWCFAPRAYGGAGPVIGADLGRTFSLLAEHVVERRGANAGSWELWLPGWGSPRSEKGDIGRTSPHRPPLRVRAMRAGWQVGFGPCPKGFGKYVGGRQWQGDFLDVLSGAYTFDADRSAGFVEHARNLGVAAGELPVRVPVDTSGCEQLTTAVREVHALGLAVDEHAGQWFTTPGDRAEGLRRLSVSRLRSPAALAAALPQAFRVVAPLEKFDLTPAEHQAWSEAFGGGWCSHDPRIEGTAFDALAVDLSSAYPLVAHRVGWWQVMTAERLDREDVTGELRRVCEQAATDPTLALDPTLWARFGLTVVEVDAQGEPLFVEVPDARRPDGRSTMAPVWCRGRHLFVTWCDVLAASILARRPVRVIHAERLVPVGRQRGLRQRAPVLPGCVVGVGDDPAVALVGRRRKAKADGDRVLASALHAAVNALVSGNPSRLDAVRRKAGKAWTIAERPAGWTFMPAAATVTSGARLLLAVLDRQVADLGGVVAYRDTDSSILAASPTGGVLRLADGTDARSLTWTEVDAALATFDALSPEPVWPVWKAERGTPEAPLRSVVFGPKRHVEWVAGPDGPALVDWTEAGLGGAFADPAAMVGRCAEGGRGWSKAVALREAAHAEAKLADPKHARRGRVPWDQDADEAFPTLRRLQVTSPVTLASLPDGLGASLGSRYLEAVPDVLAGGGRSVVALDPGGALEDWPALRWLDRSTGEPVRLTTDLAAAGHGGVVVAEALTVRASSYGTPARADGVEGVIVTALSVRYRGRVSGVIDAATIGEPGELRANRPEYIDARGLGAGQAEALVTLAKALSHNEFARRGRTTPRVARRIADGQLPAPRTCRRIVHALGDAEVADLDGRRCALEGCDRPVDRPNARYCGSTHRATARKRRQRQKVSILGGPQGGERKEGSR